MIKNTVKIKQFSSTIKPISEHARVLKHAVNIFAHKYVPDMLYLGIENNIHHICLIY